MRQDNKQLSARSNETINVYKLKESKAGLFLRLPNVMCREDVP